MLELKRSGFNYSVISKFLFYSLKGGSCMSVAPRSEKIRLDDPNFFKPRATNLQLGRRRTK